MRVITFNSSLSFFLLLTSGTVVMLMTSAPQALNMRLSALVENLGPSTVTIVPFWNLKCGFKESDFSCSFFPAQMPVVDRLVYLLYHFVRNLLWQDKLCPHIPISVLYCSRSISVFCYRIDYRLLEDYHILCAKVSACHFYIVSCVLCLHFPESSSLSSFIFPLFYFIADKLFCVSEVGSLAMTFMWI